MYDTYIYIYIYIYTYIQVCFNGETYVSTLPRRPTPALAY